MQAAHGVTCRVIALDLSDPDAVLATFDFGLDWQRIESGDTRSNIDARLTRRRLSTGTNLVVPLTSRREGFADALGSFTLNLQAGVEDLSDFGVLGDWNNPYLTMSFKAEADEMRALGRISWISAMLRKLFGILSMKCGLPALR